MVSLKLLVPLYLLAISSYYLTKDSVVKMIPAALLGLNDPFYLWASLGDYFLDSPELCSTIWSQINPIDETIQRQCAQYEFNIGLAAFNFFAMGVSTRFSGGKHIFDLDRLIILLGLFFNAPYILLLEYICHLLFFLALVWGMFQKNPWVPSKDRDWTWDWFSYTLGLSFYVLSDLFVVGDLLRITPVESMGLPFYWIGLGLIYLTLNGTKDSLEKVSNKYQKFLDNLKRNLVIQ